ncbi:hypothetical protein [Streptomyces olivaceoviridis]
MGTRLSERGRELMARARVIASADGSEQVDTRHLLAAAVEHDSTRRLLI